MINTYIIHYEKLVERKEYLSSLVSGAFWITETNKDQLSTEIKNSFYSAQKDLWEERCFGLYSFVPEYRTLSLGELSCSVNHLKAWEKFNLEDKNTLGLFLEDDIILYDNFYTNLDFVLSNISDFDAVFLGGGFHHSVAPTISTIKKNQVSFIYKGHPATNCACAYILHKNLVRKIVNFYANNKFVLPIDYEMNYIFKTLSAKVIHIDPPLCIEGSSIGKYQSSKS